MGERLGRFGRLTPGLNVVDFDVGSIGKHHISGRQGEEGRSKS